MGWVVVAGKLVWSSGVCSLVARVAVARGGRLTVGEAWGVPRRWRGVVSVAADVSGRLAWVGGWLVGARWLAWVDGD